ncbi:MAG: carboxypeptidase regulatory-like domain-containing protein [Acidobacteriales bacterium]|nr:carboxypeptidase regulatory-like domain-containing protein [Terriglobales bacterium]
MLQAKRSLWLAVIVILGISAIHLSAQTVVTGDVVGTVTDPSNAVVSAATVTLTGVDTGSTAEITTSSTGLFRFPLLKPGQYRVAVTAPNFRTTQQVVTVAVGQVTTSNIQLQLGQSSETVEVTGATPVIQTENANISTSFSPAQLDLLPNGGNDLTAVAQTAPGVTINSSSGGGFGNFVAFGLPATSNLFTVNGNDSMDPYLNLNNSGATNLLLGKNEVQETAVVSNGYTGQYGRNAGAQVDYATKSGTNAFHGNALYYFNSGGLNGNDWFDNHTNTPLPQENNNQWALSVGGPIKKDKAFFFADTEGLRYILSTSALAIVPTPAFSSAVVANLAANSAVVGGIVGAPGLNNSTGFYNQLFNLYNTAPGNAGAVPLTDSSVDTSGNLGCGDINVNSPNTLFGAPVPLVGLSQFGGVAGTPNSAYGGVNGGAGVPCAQSFRSTAGQLSTEWILSGRVDFNVGNNDKLFLRYRHDEGTQPTFTDPINPVFNAISQQPQHEGQLNWTHTLTPTVLNQFIVSGSYYSAIFRSSNQAAATAAFPYTYLNADTSAFTSIGGINFNFPQGRNVTQYQIVDDLSINRGSHSLRFGGNFRRNDITDNIFGVLTTPQQFTISNTDFVSGFIDQTVQRFPQQLSQPIALWSLGAYGQDEWRVNSSLKLTMALRLDRNSNAVCQTDCFSNLASPFNQGSTFNSNTPYNQIIQANQHTAFPDIEKVALQPRFGFAYSPKGSTSTVLRGGAGIFSDLYPGVLVDRFNRNTPSSNQFALVFGFLPFSPNEAGNAESTVTGCNSAFINNFNAGGNPSSYLASAPAGCNSPTYNSQASKLLNPKYLEWNLELQQALGNKTSFSLNYVGNHGYDEFIVNPAVNTHSAAGFQQLPTTAPYTGFTRVSLLQNTGVSNYNGLTGSLTRRFSLGFTGSLNYTWSHSLDDVSNGGVSPFSLNDSLLNQVNPYCLRCLNYSNSDYDVRHNVTANYVWDLPFKANSSFVNRVISSWTLSGTFFYHSGYPFSAFDSQAGALLFGSSGSANTVLANFTGGPTFDCNSPTNPCLNSSQFLSAGSETSFGNLRRNSFRGPGYFNSDFTVLKNIPITERFRLGIGATAYNVFNHPNFANPVGDVSSGQFGTIQTTVVPPTSPYGAFVGSAVSGRILQLNGRLTF